MSVAHARRRVDRPSSFELSWPTPAHRPRASNVRDGVWMAPRLPRASTVAASRPRPPPATGRSLPWRLDRRTSGWVRAGWTSTASVRPPPCVCRRDGQRRRRRRCRET